MPRANKRRNKKKRNYPKGIVVLREDNGRISRAGNAQHRAPPVVEVRRLRREALAGMADRRWGTELGRLHLAEKIDEAELLAGEQWAETVEEYKTALATQGAVQSASLELGARSHEPDPDSERGVKIAEHDRRAVEAMDEAHKALKRAGRLSLAVVRAVCERDEYAGGYELEKLRDGLSALVKHWRI